MKKKITFNDIAKKTNFSKTTISRYFNNPDSLTEESKKKIENALVELDYKENKVARSLANGKTEMIGIIIPDLFLHYYSQILDSLINTYPKYKYKFLVFVGNNNRDEEMNYINELLAYQIEGLIILSHSIDSKTLSELNIPIVSIEREDKYISSVNSDNYYGSLQATNLLINNNCDMLIHINGGVKEDTPSYKRIEAFKTACETNNINYKCYLSKIGSTFDTAYHNIYNIYEDIEKKYPNGKKGIFLSNDTHANILLNILIKNKKNIPDEYEIIGFDNSPISMESILPITTVKQDIVKIAEEGQEPHHDLPQRVAVVRQGVGPGIHPQKDHGVVLVPGGVEEAGVHIRADQRQEQQDVQEPEARRRPLVEEPHAADHGEEVEELPQEDGHDLPQHREDVGEDLQPPHLIKPVGQHPFQKGDLLEGVQDAVDPVCIFQGE